MSPALARFVHSYWDVTSKGSASLLRGFAWGLPFTSPLRGFFEFCHRYLMLALSLFIIYIANKHIYKIVIMGGSQTIKAWGVGTCA